MRGIKGDKKEGKGETEELACRKSKRRKAF